MAKRLKRFLLMIIFITPTNARADALPWIGAGLHIIDCLQTREFAGRMPELQEQNFLLGSNPTPREINLWCAGFMGVHYAVNKYASPKTKQRWNWAFVLTKTYVVGSNYRIGVRIKW